MADTAFTVHVGPKTYTLNKVKLGDWRMFKTEFGLDADDVIAKVMTDNGPVEMLNLANPNVLVALMVAALRHERPHAPLSVLIAEIEDVDMSDIEFVRPGEDEAEESDPTRAGADAEGTDARSKAGKSGTRPKKPGARSSD